MRQRAARAALWGEGEEEWRPAPRYHSFSKNLRHGKAAVAAEFCKNFSLPRPGLSAEFKADDADGDVVAPDIRVEVEGEP